MTPVSGRICCKARKSTTRATLVKEAGQKSGMRLRDGEERVRKGVQKLRELVADLDDDSRSWRWQRSQSHWRMRLLRDGPPHFLRETLTAMLPDAEE